MTWPAALARRGAWVRLCAYAALGALAGFGQAPWGLWPLTLAVLAVAVIALQAELGWKRCAWAVWALGTGYFAVTLHWIVQPFLVDVARHGWMAPFALMFMATGMALFWGAAGALTGAVRGPFRPVMVVAALGLAELARSLVLTGFPWALLGHIWIGTPLDQLAAWVGPHGLSLLTLALAALIAVLWARVWLAAPLALVAALWLVLDPGPPPEPAGDAQIVRLVQPNARQDLKWQPGMAEQFFQTQLELTANGDMGAVPGRVPDLVVWPETAVQWLLEHSEDVLRDVSLAAKGAPVMLGILRRDGPLYYNSLVVVDAGGEVSALYDKWHLVPFGEYVPFGELAARFGIRGLAANEGGGYASGPGPALVEVPGIGPAMPLVCYEGIFAEEVNAAPGRARLLTLITNDAWFGSWAGPEQHFAQARLRAIEQGLPMVRVANTGISGMIDARGRVLGRIALGVEGALDVALPAALPPTGYTRWGDWPVAVLLVFLAALAFARRRQNAVDGHRPEA